MLDKTELNLDLLGKSHKKLDGLQYQKKNRIIEWRYSTDFERGNETVFQEFVYSRCPYPSTQIRPPRPWTRLYAFADPLIGPQDAQSREPSTCVYPRDGFFETQWTLRADYWLQA
jgi:hypothetical protein